MEYIIRCVPITLDPNTAHATLKFSEELTCVQYGSQQALPHNPERCTSRVSVLGATGFRSGKHSWTVDVSQAKDWCIGVARESINRKSTIFLSPPDGFWVIGQANGDSLYAQTTSRTTITMKQKPEKVAVELDCDKGKVIFTNAADSKVIHTFKDKFAEAVLPYFSLGLCDDKKNANKLRICPQTINVKIE
ncbi:zinc-binding protein A33-like [Pholidichthys leucotaenia]